MLREASPISRRCATRCVFQIVTVLTHGLSSIRDRPVRTATIRRPCMHQWHRELTQGRPTDSEVILSRILGKAIRRSNALDTESLCIIAGVKCFALHADVHIINHDGGLINALCIAIMAALQHFWRACWLKERKRLSSATASASRFHCQSYTSRFV
jgi:hypothetical protein